MSVVVWEGSEIPHVDLLSRATVGLGSLKGRIDALNGELERLREVGVYLTDDLRPVVPGLSKRKDNGRVVGYVLVWPTWYARKAGVKRRRYVGKRDLESVQACRSRTCRYFDLKESRDRLVAELLQAGRELGNLVAWYGW